MAQIHLRGQVPEALELLDEVEQRMKQERQKELNMLKWYIILFFVLFAFAGIMAMCEG